MDIYDDPDRDTAHPFLQTYRRISPANISYSQFAKTNLNFTDIPISETPLVSEGKVRPERRDFGRRHLAVPPRYKPIVFRTWFIGGVILLTIGLIVLLESLIRVLPQ